MSGGATRQRAAGGGVLAVQSAYPPPLAAGGRRSHRGALASERGAAALEFALLLPILLVLLGVMMMAGRLWMARSALLAVVRNADRQAVLQPSAPLAAATATSAGQSAAKTYGLDAGRLSIDPQGPFGPGELYRVQASYVVELGDLPGLGFLPGSVTVSAASVEPIDPNTAQ